MKIIYIAGAGRSGSTLLCRTLGMYRGVFAAGELFHFFDRAMLNNELCGCGRRARACELWGQLIEEIERSGLRDRTAEHAALTRRLLQGGLLPQFLLPWKTSSLRHRLQEYQGRLARILALITRATGARAIVDSSKSPIFGRLLTLIPDTRVHVVHLVRDSRGVIHSWSGRHRRRTGVPSRVEYLTRHRVSSGLLLWTAAQLGAELLGRRADSYTRIRYEDFVTNPWHTLRALAPVHGGVPLPKHAGVHGFDLGVQHVLAGNTVRMARGWVPVREDDEWRTSMPPARQRFVTSFTFHLLFRYGYLGDSALANPEEAERSLRDQSGDLAAGSG